MLLCPHGVQYPVRTIARGRGEGGERKQKGTTPMDLTIQEAQRKWKNGTNPVLVTWIVRKGQPSPLQSWIQRRGDSIYESGARRFEVAPQYESFTRDLT